MPSPMALKLSMPTTAASTKALTLAGPCTPNPNRPTARRTTTSTVAMIMELTMMAVSRTQVGSGLSRIRLSSPTSRRLTVVMAKILKQAAMIP